MYRSTKGASKARRDQINTEIRNLKDLLPITDTDKARLSYLHIMSLACMYTRKSLFFSQDTSRDQSSGLMSFHELSELIHELAGFMVVVTGEGKLLHLSENVVDHLGLCMVDLVAQSDSVYDIVDPSDHFVMRSSLAPSVPGDADRLFRCHFNTSKFLRRQGSGNKAMLVRARCLPPPGPGSSHSTSTPVWVCFCTPLRLKPSAHTPPLTPPPEHSFLLASFHSQHLRDMTVWDVHNSVTMYLGYDVEALRSRSWYSLLHPRDLSHASTQHCALLSEGGDKQVDMVVQVETADHSWVWLYMVLQMGAGEHPITCNNYVISESEAWSLRQQLSVEQQSHSSGYYSSGDCMHRQSSLSSPDQVFTPSSSGLSAQSFDFSAAPSGSSFSDEAMQPSEQHPRSSLSSLEEESLTHGRQQWYSERSGPAPISPPVSLTESDFLNQRVPSHSVGLSDPVSPSLTEYLTPVSMPLTHQMGEFACTPPYTPQLTRGFSFGERLHLSLDLTNTVASSTCQKLHTFAGADRTHSFSGSISSEEATLMLPREYYRASDGFSEGECNTMSVSEIWGSLYVDVAQKPMNGHPHGLLTPENSPTQHPGSFLFSSAVEQEKEREEISTLARYLSSLAESFSCKSLVPKQPLSFLPPSPSPPPKSQSQNSVCENKLHPWMATEQSHQRDVCLYEENALLEILYEDLASFPSSPSSYSTASPSTSSSPCSPQTPTSRDYSIGVDHFSSVLSTRCNCMAVDGATMATGAATTTSIQETAEDVMMMDTSELPSSASLAASLEPASLEPASQEPASILGHSAPPHTVPHDRFLMQELVAMDQVFEADAYISSFWGNSLSCINSHSTTMASRSFHQGGSLRDPAF